jgi:lipase (class 3)
MSEPDNPALAAALPLRMTRKCAANRLARGVCAAYAAYNNGGTQQQPTLDGYIPSSFQLIYVYETMQEEAEARAEGRVARLPAAYAGGAAGSPDPCSGPGGGWQLPGQQLFGFTATANDYSHNILVLRGTVTSEEAGYDLYDWADTTPCVLPSSGLGPQSSPALSYGNVKDDLYNFYTVAHLLETSLAASCMSAIQNSWNASPQLPWIMGAHSLGGAILSLAAFDAVLSGLVANPFVMTFGSLHVGDATFAKYYTHYVPASYRVANLCDFVPSIVSLEPVVNPADPYVHVGIPGTFVWQKWDNWGNHHLSSIYMPIVHDHWDMIFWGDCSYPQPGCCHLGSPA